MLNLQAKLQVFNPTKSGLWPVQVAKGRFKTNNESLGAGCNELQRMLAGRQCKACRFGDRVLPLQEL